VSELASEPSAQHPYSLVVLGDSFAEGRGDPGPAGTYVGWVPRVARLLGIAESAVLNLGAFRALTQDVVDTQLKQVADVTTPLLGVAVGATTWCARTTASGSRPTCGRSSRR